mmetsp:Transcript_15667/g.44775  ORF Transcript_15667/g.44775 Transcript_15667/m.44775 type:complete len:89 (+) Transcript_15667:168-434(+)
MDKREPVLRTSVCMQAPEACNVMQARLPATKEAKRPAWPVLSSLASYTYALSVVHEAIHCSSYHAARPTHAPITHHGPPAGGVWAVGM